MAGLLDSSATDHDAVLAALADHRVHVPVAANGWVVFLRDEDAYRSRCCGGRCGSAAATRPVNG